MGSERLDEIMAAVADGDNAAFETLYRLSAKGIYAFAYSYLKNRQDAEDIMQSAFLQIKRKAYTYCRGTNAKAWMLQIVKNLALDELRKRKRFRERFADESEKGNAVTYNKDVSALDYMMKSLSDEEREVVILHALWGYKHKEIAEIKNQPVGTITWRYNTAVKKLEKYKEEDI